MHRSSSLPRRAVGLLSLVALAVVAPAPGGAGALVARMQPAVATEAAAGDGYWLVGGDGGVFAFGAAPFLGSAAGTSTRPVVDIAKTRSGQGYWLAAEDGGVFSFGDARFFGSLPGRPGVAEGETVVAMASAQVFGDGYYLVTAQGGVYTFGAAPFFGAPASGPVPYPIVDFGLTPSGHGYWLVDSAGDIRAYGDAAPLEGPEVDPRRVPAGDRRIALEPWSGASVHVMSVGGGVFTASTSRETGFFYGSSPDTGRPMADLAGCGCPGYHQVDVDGTVYAQGDAPRLGSLPDIVPPGSLAAPVVALLGSGPAREL